MMKYDQIIITSVCIGNKAFVLRISIYTYNDLFMLIFRADLETNYSKSLSKIASKLLKSTQNSFG